jgi:hypothetical protein
VLEEKSAFCSLLPFPPPSSPHQPSLHHHQETLEPFPTHHQHIIHVSVDDLDDGVGAPAGAQHEHDRLGRLAADRELASAG